MRGYKSIRQQSWGIQHDTVIPEQRLQRQQRLKQAHQRPPLSLWSIYLKKVSSPSEWRRVDNQPEQLKNSDARDIRLFHDRGGGIFHVAVIFSLRFFSDMLAEFPGKETKSTVGRRNTARLLLRRAYVRRHGKVRPVRSGGAEKRMVVSKKAFTFYGKY
jgi:hypothetical protein